MTRIGMAGWMVLWLIGCNDGLKVKWKFPIGAPSGSTPLVTDSFIAFGSGAGLHILEKSGTRRCDFDPHGEVISAPKTDGERIYFGTVRFLFYAIDAQCKELWKFTAQDRIKSDPLIDGGRVYTSSYDGHVYALDAATGKMVWSFPGLVAALDPDVHEGLQTAEEVIMAGAAAPAPPAGVAPGGFSYSSPAIHDGIVYLGNLDGNLYAINASDGSLQWKWKTRAMVTSSPLIEGDTLYFASNDGTVIALDLLVPGRKLWGVATKDWVNSSPHLRDGVVYIGTHDRQVMAIESSTGQGHWSFQTDGPVVAIPSSYRDFIVAADASSEGNIYVLNRDKGTLAWKHRTGGSIRSDPVVDGDTLYVTSYDGYLYALDLRSKS